MKIISLLIVWATLSNFANAGDVSAICSKTGLGVLTLKERDNSGNLAVIRSSDLGKSELAQYLRQTYRGAPPDQKQFVKLAELSNKKYISKSILKDNFLKYSSGRSKLADPEAYRAVLLASIEELVPREMNYSSWFLKLKDPLVSSTAIRPAVKDETSTMYGAVSRAQRYVSGKYKIEIIFSNNDSEPMPYLIPLVVHEFQHVITYKEKFAMMSDKDQVEFGIIEEAKGFDAQMKAYVALASKRPELFCNWLYPTWAYGDLLVPLSWTMNSMEEEMKSGKFIFNYARTGMYKGKDFLLNKTKTALRPDIQSRIDGLKLKYVK